MASYYLQPDGVSRYLLPDGVSFYIIDADAPAAALLLMVPPNKRGNLALTMRAGKQ